MPFRDSGFKSSNGHTVRQIGRHFYFVSSKSRINMFHVVDLEGFEGWPVVCTCEAFRFGTDRPCRHLRACLELELEGLQLAGIELEEAISRVFELIAVDVPIEQPEESELPSHDAKRHYKLKAA